jgi:hypothetical protein
MYSFAASDAIRTIMLKNQIYTVGQDAAIQCVVLCVPVLSQELEISIAIWKLFGASSDDFAVI